MTSPILGLAIALAAFASVAVGEPSCTQTEVGNVRRVVCKHFMSSEDFAKYVKRGVGEDLTKKTWFKLEDSRLERFPDRAFADLNIYKLAFYNVSVMDFAQQGPTGNPFEGLEDTLREVVFHSGSTLPPSWSVFQGIHKLEEVCIDDYENLRLTTDFNKLPKTVKSIYVTKSTVEHVDPDWLTSLENLEALVLRKTSLKVFSRRWLPMPAPNFFLLDLPDNQLEAFPEGLADDLPRLSVVNLQRNKLTTVDEKAVAPLKDKTVFVNFADNPMHCDCRLRFLLTYTHRWHYFLCRTPQSLFDRYFLRLTEEDLQCSATAPLSSA
uniref:Putative extracellular matrix protein slit n=1 Tax=Rhipicephalus microplus TaxID=6941 RepID=A0A6G5A5X5_RHIMP